MRRLRRYAREAAHTRTPRHRARPVRRAAVDAWSDAMRDHIWTGYIHDWAERRRALYANTGSVT